MQLMAIKATQTHEKYNFRRESSGHQAAADSICIICARSCLRARIPLNSSWHETPRRAESRERKPRIELSRIIDAGTRIPQWTTRRCIGNRGGGEGDICPRKRNYKVARLTVKDGIRDRISDSANERASADVRFPVSSVRSVTND